MTTITLPFPISVNGTFRKFKGSHLSERYRAWRDAAGIELLSQRPKRLLGPVSVTMELCPPDERRRDIDNLWKGVLDLLVAHGVIQGDDRRYVKEAIARWVDTGAPCTVTVRAA